MKIHKFFKRICFLLTVILAARFTTIPCFAASSNKNLSVWYSDEDKAGYWETAPTVYRIPLSSSFSTSLVSYVAAANTQWKGIRSFTYATSESAATIVCYGGTRQEMSDAGITEDFGTVTGRTKHSEWDSYQYSRSYGDSSKKIYAMNYAIIYVLDIDGRTANQTKKTTIHEFGHALGWFGHSSNNSDVMWQGTSTVTTVTTRDKAHLSQIY